MRIGAGASRATHFSIRELMKTETLQDSPETYSEKIGGKRRNVSAAYELALKAGRPYLSGDQISYYVAGRGTQGQGQRGGADGGRNTTRPIRTRTSSITRPSSPSFTPSSDPMPSGAGLFSPGEVEGAAEAPEQQLDVQPGCRGQVTGK